MPGSTLKGPYGYEPGARRKHGKRVRPPVGYKPSQQQAPSRDYWPVQDSEANYWPSTEPEEYIPSRASGERGYRPKHRSRKSPKGYWRRNPYLSIK